uniref:Uncharacterized protein n=1 Tax=Ananas comosus var. bracteatus TaxID=296719 RepID=A0A6V7NNF2_ANACO|nr:unnamed protein product [Ananas comosus var. bracteatus]
MGGLKSSGTSSVVKQKPPPASPTASVSESNIVTSSDPEHLQPDQPERNDAIAIPELKFELDLGLEVQSPDNAMWDSLFADVAGADFMIESPRRDYMVCSPRRDYMACSPKRENVTISSPKRTFLMNNNSYSSYHNNNYAYVSGVHGLFGCTTQTTYLSPNHNKGKSLSPLHKVFNYSSSSSTSLLPLYASSAEFVRGDESLPLPAVDAFLDEYKEGVMRRGRGGGGEAAAGAQGGGEGTDHVYQNWELQQLASCGGELADVAKSEWADPSYQDVLGAIVPPSDTEQEQDSGLELVHLLLACAEAIAKDDYLAARYLHHLHRVVSPVGDSMQRVASCFADALSARLSPPSAVPTSSSLLHRPPPFPFPPSLDVLRIYQILYQVCPYVKFAHFTANQAIFEAFEGEDRVHVVDLDILQGYQWPAFLQALAARPGGAPSLRITGVGHSAAAVSETGRHLAELAHSLRVPFEFHAAAAGRLEDLRPRMLHRRVGEALAVNAVNRLHCVAAPHLGPLLAMIRDQAPKIVTLVEQEASHNGPSFLGRLGIGQIPGGVALLLGNLRLAGRDTPGGLGGADEGGAVPVRAGDTEHRGVRGGGEDGAARAAGEVEEGDGGKGFHGVPLSANAVNQSRLLLGLYTNCDGYRLTEDNGCLLLGWQDRALIAASAWRC